MNAREKAVARGILAGLVLSYPVLLPLPAGLQVIFAGLSIYAYSVAFRNLP